MILINSLNAVATTVIISVIGDSFFNDSAKAIAHHLTARDSGAMAFEPVYARTEGGVLDAIKDCLLFISRKQPNQPFNVFLYVAGQYSETPRGLVLLDLGGTNDLDGASTTNDVAMFETMASAVARFPLVRDVQLVTELTNMDTVCLNKDWCLRDPARSFNFVFDNIVRADVPADDKDRAYYDKKHFNGITIAASKDLFEARGADIVSLFVTTLANILWNSGAKETLRFALIKAAYATGSQQKKDIFGCSDVFDDVAFDGVSRPVAKYAWLAEDEKSISVFCSSLYSRSPYQSAPIGSARKRQD